MEKTLSEIVFEAIDSEVAILRKYRKEGLGLSILGLIEIRTLKRLRSNLMDEFYLYYKNKEMETDTLISTRERRNNEWRIPFQFNRTLFL